MLVLLSSFFTIRLLSKFTLKTSQEEFLRYMLENQNAFVRNSKSNYSYFHRFMTSLISFDLSNPLSLLHTNYKGLTSSDDVREETKSKGQEVLKKVNKETVVNPTIYLYNTHQTEEYKATSFAEYNVRPNVMMADYVLKEALNEKGHRVLVEETNVATVRSNLGLTYAGSYEVTKSLLANAKNNYPSLNYFVDLHRDSIGYDKTTLITNETRYAKILFIVGLENPNYQENLAFTTKIHEGLNQKLAGLSKGIYKKEGTGVNGVYNQDFSPRTILVELGGSENTIDEVYRTLLILADVLDEVIKSEAK